MVDKEKLEIVGRAARASKEQMHALMPRETDLFRDVMLQRSPSFDELNFASEFHERLVKMINEFDAKLDHAHEVGVRLVSFGQTVTFHLVDLGFFNPSLIRFYGNMEDGQPVELIQHVSQISILLTKMARKNPEEPKRPIGFHGETATEDSEQTSSPPG